MLPVANHCVWALAQVLKACMQLQLNVNLLQGGFMPAISSWMAQTHVIPLHVQLVQAANS